MGRGLRTALALAGLMLAPANAALRAGEDEPEDGGQARSGLRSGIVVPQAYLKASNTQSEDRFGQAAAVSGDTAAVAAPREDSGAQGVNGNQSDNSAADSGAAYVFVRSFSAWAQQAYLKSLNSEAGDGFGESIGISGDTLVVGAYHEDSGAAGNPADNSRSGAGAAYVFVRNGTAWGQQAYLKASHPDIDDWYGKSVAVDGDTVAVGAVFEDSAATGVNGNASDNSVSGSGAVYVYVRNGTTWTQQAYIKASNTGAGDEFGTSVALDGDTLVVGAQYEDSAATGVNGVQTDNSASASGAAYVFVRNGTTWSQQAYLKASNTGAQDNFGGSVSISGDTVVVGAATEDSAATGADGDGSNNAATNAGAVYVFVRSGTTWTQQAYLKASNTDAGDRFGYSVGVSGDVLVSGAFLEDGGDSGVNGDESDNSISGAGAAYVFVRDGTTWDQLAYLKASNPGGGTPTGDNFGFPVALSGGTIAAGATLEDSNAVGVNGNESNNSATNAGAAYVFAICPTLGNLNCDCAVDMGDVDAFVQALLDPAEYALWNPNCAISHGDMQPDGSVDGADVQAFLDLLVP